MSAAHALALALAALTANEAGLGRDEPPVRDLGVIIQAADYHASTDAGRLRWLRRHSARVLGDRECRPGRNCQWTRGLEWNDAQPPGWPSAAVWRPERWRRLRALALRAVTSERPPGPCPVPIVSWGSRADFEANRFGWIPVDCGALNLGATTAEIIRRAGRRAPTRSPHRVQRVPPPRSRNASGSRAIRAARLRPPRAARSSSRR